MLRTDSLKMQGGLLEMLAHLPAVAVQLGPDLRSLRHFLTATDIADPQSKTNAQHQQYGASTDHHHRTHSHTL